MSASPPPQEAPALDPVKPVRPQLLVALGGRSEEDAALVRAAHRHAQREGVVWRAVHVDNGRAGPRQRLALDLAYFALVLAALPWAVAEAVAGRGATIMLEAQKC